jgi:hypothetical protein
MALSLVNEMIVEIGPNTEKEFLGCAVKLYCEQESSRYMK